MVRSDVSYNASFRGTQPIAFALLIAPDNRVLDNEHMRETPAVKDSLFCS